MQYKSLFGQTSQSGVVSRETIPSRERFRIRTQLGEGGFGTVWRVHDKWLKQDAALKVSNQSLEQEVKVLRCMPSDQFVRPFDYLRGNDGYGYLMELMQSPWILASDFFSSFQQNAPRPLDPPALKQLKRGKAALQVTVHLLDALSHLHGKRWARRERWCHADIKPNNIWVDADLLRSSIKRWDSADRPLVKIGDLGLVTARGAACFAGAYGYQSPEQRAGDQLTPACDIFAAAQTCMALITGQPLAAEDLISIERITNVILQHVPNAYVGKGIARLIRRMTYTSPSQRPWASEAAAQASRIISNDREWAVLEVLASSPLALPMKDALDALFPKLAVWAGWKNRSNVRLTTIRKLMADMSRSGKITRRGYKYHL